MVTYVQIAIVILAVSYAIVFFKDIVKNRKELTKDGLPALAGIGFVTNFLDTLGIGSFAPQTAFFKFFGLVEDKLIPGTLNVGNAIPLVLQALIFLTLIKVEPVTLISMLLAATLGGFIGAGIVAKLPVRKIQIGLGAALLTVAFALFSGLMKWFPIGGEASGLKGLKLILAVTTSFILGALHNIGIGFYAPCMALVSALGMNPILAFPIMMGSAAMLTPGASIRFIKEKAHDRKASLALLIFGSPGVFLAAYVVTSLPLTTLKWVVLVVITYASFTMFKSAAKKTQS